MTLQQMSSDGGSDWEEEGEKHKWHFVDTEKSLGSGGWSKQCQSTGNYRSGGKKTRHIFCGVHGVMI